MTEEQEVQAGVIFNGNVAGEETKVLKLLGRVLKNPMLGEHCSTLLVKHRRELAEVTTIDGVAAVSPMVVEWLQEQVLVKHDLTMAEKAHEWKLKANNRVLYTSTGVVEFHRTETKQGVVCDKSHGKITLANPGLLTCMQEHLHGVQQEPCTISLLNSLPPSKELGLPHEPVAQHFWDTLGNLNVAVVGGRLAIQKSSPIYQDIKRALPDAIDGRSYLLGVNAPLIAGGYLPEVQVTFRNLQVLKPSGWRLRDLNELKAITLEVFYEAATRGLNKSQRAELVEDIEESWLGIQEARHLGQVLGIFQQWGTQELVRKERTYVQVPAQDDGSGRYHPDCPEMAQLVAQHGLVAFQIRGLDTTRGIFIKGIVIPDESSMDSVGAPCITLSWKQVKGKLKKVAGQMAVANQTMVRTMHLGILRDWDKKRQMTGCFELLENISAVRRAGESDEALEARKEQICEDLHSLVDQAMSDLGKDGIEGLLATLAKDDKMLSLVVKLLAKAKLEGIEVDPMGIDRVKQALSTKLRNRLWRISQGAGIEGRQLVMVIDASLEPGECVTAHHRVGTEMACWRFPLVLSQGLKTLKCVEARPHQLVRGNIVEQVIYMNPSDVLDQQGDDDGDICAVSTDPRVIRLFSNRVDDRRFHIEPKGVKMSLPIESAKGIEYLRETPMGAVGVMTMNRAKLLAVGDVMGALAMSVLVQECIDKAKRKVRWTDWESACVIENWDVVDGAYQIHAEGTDHNFLDQREDDAEELPIMKVQKWVKARLEMHGCAKDQSSLGWRKNLGETTNYKGEVDVAEIHKQIDPAHWQLSRENQNGYEGGNLVHESNDRAWRQWQLIADEFKGTSQAGDVGTLLIQLLGRQGVEATVPDYRWSEYMKVRQLAGITEFAERMKEAMQLDSTQDDGSPNKDRYTKIDEAHCLLQAQLREYVQGNSDVGLEGAGVQGLLDIWCMETTPTYRVGDRNEGYQYYSDLGSIPKGTKFTQVNNPNHAINSVCWPGSPVMTLLGISGQDACGFLNPRRLKKIIATVVEKPDAFGALSEIIWKQQVGGVPNPHERLHGGKPLWACEDCRKTLQTTLVRWFRAARGRSEKKFLGRIVGALNANETLVREQYEQAE